MIKGIHPREQWSKLSWYWDWNQAHLHPASAQSITDLPLPNILSLPCWENCLSSTKNPFNNYSFTQPHEAVDCCSGFLSSFSILISRVHLFIHSLATSFIESLLSARHMLPEFGGVYSLSHWGIWHTHAPVWYHKWYGKSQIVTGRKQKGHKQIPLRKPFSYLLHKALFHLAQHCSNLLLRIRIIHLPVKKITRGWIVNIKLNYPSAQQREHKGFIIFALRLTLKFINVKWMDCHSHKRATWGPTIRSTPAVRWVGLFIL